MVTIKSFTSLEQSKKLAEILPLESADMYYSSVPVREWKDKGDTSKGTHVVFKDQIFALENLPNGQIGEGDTYAWSLAALLGVLPNNKHITTTLSRGGWKIDPVEYIDRWFCEYEDEVDEDSPCKNFSVSADNPVDACVAMIEKLNELNLL